MSPGLAPRRIRVNEHALTIRVGMHVRGSGNELERRNIERTVEYVTCPVGGQYESSLHGAATSRALVRDPRCVRDGPVGRLRGYETRSAGEAKLGSWGYALLALRAAPGILRRFGERRLSDRDVGSVVGKGGLVGQGCHENCRQGITSTKKTGCFAPSLFAS